MKTKGEANAKLQGELIVELEKHSFCKEELAAVCHDLEGTRAELRGTMNNNDAYLVDGMAALEDLKIERVQSSALWSLLDQVKLIIYAAWAVGCIWGAKVLKRLAVAEHPSIELSGSSLGYSAMILGSLISWMCWRETTATTFFVRMMKLLPRRKKS